MADRINYKSNTALAVAVFLGGTGALNSQGIVNAIFPGSTIRDNQIAIIKAQELIIKKIDKCHQSRN